MNNRVAIPVFIAFFLLLAAGANAVQVKFISNTAFCGNAWAGEPSECSLKFNVTSPVTASITAAQFKNYFSANFKDKLGNLRDYQDLFSSYGIRVNGATPSFPLLVQAGKNYTVELWGIRKWSYDNATKEYFLENIDAIPSVFGENQAQWAWWSSSYNYRKAVGIAANGDAVTTSMTINLSLDTATLIGAGKMNANCSDLRVVSNDNLTEIDRHVFGCSAADTLIRFRNQATIAVGGTATYWLYYGNAGASSPSPDYNKVYFQWDDWSNGGVLNTSRWNPAFGTWVITGNGGTGTLSDTAANADKWLKTTANNTYGTGTVIEAYVNVSQVAAAVVYYGFSSGSATITKYIRPASSVEQFVTTSTAATSLDSGTLTVMSHSTPQYVGIFRSEGAALGSKAALLYPERTLNLSLAGTGILAYDVGAYANNIDSKIWFSNFTIWYFTNATVTWAAEEHGDTNFSSVTLNTPASTSYYGKNLTLSYFWVGNASYATANCTTYLDGAIFLSRIASNNTNYSDVKYPIWNGTHSAYVSCANGTDSLFSSVASFTMLPTLNFTVVNPANSTLTAYTNVSFSFSDNLGAAGLNASACNYYVWVSLGTLGNFTGATGTNLTALENDTSITLQLLGLHTGYPHALYVNCTKNGFTNSSNWRYWTYNIAAGGGVNTTLWNVTLSPSSSYYSINNATNNCTFNLNAVNTSNATQVPPITFDVSHAGGVITDQITANTTYDYCRAVNFTSNATVPHSFWNQFVPSASYQVSEDYSVPYCSINTSVLGIPVINFDTDVLAALLTVPVANNTYSYCKQNFNINVQPIAHVVGFTPNMSYQEYNNTLEYCATNASVTAVPNLTTTGTVASYLNGSTWLFTNTTDYCATNITVTPTTNWTWSCPNITLALPSGSGELYDWLAAIWKAEKEKVV